MSPQYHRDWLFTVIATPFLDVYGSPGYPSGITKTFQNIGMTFIFYQKYFKNLKNTHAGVVLLVKLQASACNLTERNTPQWGSSTFLKYF